MANPQKEEGYTPISNELLDAIYRTDFTASELKTLLFIFRYTYGFSRKECELSLTFIAKGVGISKRYISSTVNKLVDDNVLVVVKEHTDTQSRIIKINKDYDKWKNRIIIQQMNQSSTGDAQNNTTDEVEFIPTDEVQFNTTDELQFNQDKQTLKQNKNNIYTPHSKKHKFGEYQHVLLSDTEIQRLKEEYGEKETLDAIHYLDEYIEMKKPKYNNHNLVLRKWVFNAVQENKTKNNWKGGMTNAEQSEGYGHVQTTTEIVSELRAEAEARGEAWQLPHVDGPFK